GSKNIVVDKLELVADLRHEDFEDSHGKKENDHSTPSKSICSLETAFCEDRSLTDLACKEVPDLEMAAQSLVALKDAQSKENQLIHPKVQNFSKSVIAQYPGNYSLVQGMRPSEDDGYGYDSGHDSGSTSSFEFHMGNRAFRRSVLISFSKSVPSKWDDAEKWLVNHSCAHDHVKKKSKHPADSSQAIPTHSSRKVITTNQLGHQTSITKDAPQNASVILADHMTVGGSLYQDEGETKKIDSEVQFTQATSNATFANSKDSLDCHPSEDVFSQNPHDQKEEDNETFFKSSLQSLKPIVDSALVSNKHVSMRDMGTEMTPIASQDPSRTGTPIRATTPIIQSPFPSQPSTPLRVAPASLLMEAAESELGHGEKVRTIFSGKDLQIKSREIMVPGTQLGKINIADWASKEEEESDASKSLKTIDLEEAKRHIWEVRAAAWQEAEEAKYMARYKQEEAKIQSWENHQKAKAESEMMDIEVKVERMKSHAHEKLLYKLAALQQHAEQKRATARARQDGQAAKIRQRAGYAQNGLLDEAVRLSNTMPVRDAVSWNAFIVGCSQNGLLERGMEIFKQMQLAELFMYRKDPKTIAETISNGFVDVAREWWDANPHQTEILDGDLKDFKEKLNNGDPSDKTNFNRLEKWGMWFDNYSFEVEYIKGDDNSLADFASRELNQFKQINIAQFRKEKANIQIKGEDSKSIPVGEGKTLQISKVATEKERQRKFSSTSIAPNFSQPTFHAMGTGLHWSHQSKFKPSHKWILTATDYFTKWTEAVALKEANESSIRDFYEGIVTRFGVPATIISNNVLEFIGSKITRWAVNNVTYLRTSSNYCPQGNGQVESTNKKLVKIIREPDTQSSNHPYGLIG
ncbi:hypothetical protein KI387_001255, partial [Taxus chinensis]